MSLRNQNFAWLLLHSETNISQLSPWSSNVFEVKNKTKQDSSMIHLASPQPLPAVFFRSLLKSCDGRTYVLKLFENSYHYRPRLRSALWIKKSRLASKAQNQIGKYSFNRSLMWKQRRKSKAKFEGLLFLGTKGFFCNIFANICQKTY